MTDSSTARYNYLEYLALQEMVERVPQLVSHAQRARLSAVKAKLSP